DADPELDPPLGIDADIALGEAALDRDRTIDCGGRAGEFGQDRIARDLHQAAAGIADGGQGNSSESGSQGGDGADLVRAHEAAIPDHIGIKDRRRTTVQCDRGTHATPVRLHPRLRPSPTRLVSSLSLPPGKAPNGLLIRPFRVSYDLRRIRFMRIAWRACLKAPSRCRECELRAARPRLQCCARGTMQPGPDDPDRPGPNLV